MQKFASRRPVSLAGAVGLLVVVVSCAAPVVEPVSKQDFIMDTSIVLTLYGDKAEAVANQVFDRLKEIDAHVRVQSQASEVWAVNAAAGQQAVKVSDDTLAIATIGLDLARLSGGVFDPTIGPVSLLWDIEGEHPKVPATAELTAARALVGWQDVRLDATTKTIYLTRPGMRLDFGGVAKGYAALEAAKICRQAGMVSALLNMGDSSIFVLGSKPNGKKWRIGIQNPDAVADNAVDRGKLLGVVEVADRVVESSGTYERFFVQDGKRYHHIMDVKTGFPVDNGLEQVTLILPSDTRFADGLSTTVFALGPVAGLALVEGMKDAAAILVGSDHSVRLSSRVKDSFSLDDPAYHLVEAAAQ